MKITYYVSASVKAPSALIDELERTNNTVTTSDYSATFDIEVLQNIEDKPQFLHELLYTLESTVQEVTLYSD